VQRAEMEVVREVILSAAAAPIDDIELGQLTAKLYQVFTEVLKETANEIDNRILQSHYRRHLGFSEIAAEIGISEISMRRRWYGLMERVSDTVQSRVSRDPQLASIFSSITESPDAFRLAIPMLLSAQSSALNTGLSAVSPELDILKRAAETFGSHGEAVRWLLDDCPALNGRPIDLVIDLSGVQSVENVLGCIDHGMIY
jgi:hypothetical protein